MMKSVACMSMVCSCACFGAQEDVRDPRPWDKARAKAADEFLVNCK